MLLQYFYPVCSFLGAKVNKKQMRSKQKKEKNKTKGLPLWQAPRTKLNKYFISSEIMWLKRRCKGTAKIRTAQYPIIGI
jgi:hypothetical protein